MSYLTRFEPYFPGDGRRMPSRTAAALAERSMEVASLRGFVFLAFQNGQSQVHSVVVKTGYRRKLPPDCQRAAVTNSTLGAMNCLFAFTSF
jgi:hypothetical protein